MYFYWIYDQKKQGRFNIWGETIKKNSDCSTNHYRTYHDFLVRSISTKSYTKVSKMQKTDETVTCEDILNSAWNSE